MNLEEAKEKLEINSQEVDSLQRYTGFWHTVVNTLCNMDPDIYMNLEKAGWKMPETSEEVEKAIEDFVNIYSAMYKNSKGNRYVGHLIRGTGEKDISRIGNRTNQFLSTSTSEEIARTFSHYGDDALVRIKIANDVPYINMDEYHSSDSRNEHEVLVAPFCEVADKRLSSNWQGYKYYDLKLTKPKLQERSEIELSKLREQITSKFTQNLDNMKEYLHYSNLVQTYDERYRRARGTDLEYQKELSKQKKEASDKMHEAYSKVYKFKTDLRSLLEGLCKRKRNRNR